ncbi:MAG TPA: hypothetical protein VN620_00955, partial [Candidatus Methylomirabilis sp.]|nr:hypothetical protein [Candidatus Methylomirabilis sp.]
RALPIHTVVGNASFNQSEERFLASSTPLGITESLLSKPSSYRCVRVYFHLEAVGDSQIGGGKSDVVEELTP